MEFTFKQLISLNYHPVKATTDESGFLRFPELYPVNMNFIAKARQTFYALTIFSTSYFPIWIQPALSQTADQVSVSGTDSIESTLNLWERQIIQEGLILLGYYNGFADGSLGANSRAAIASYQVGKRRTETGRISAQDALELANVTLDLREKLGWKPLNKSRSNISISYPSNVLVKSAENKIGGENLYTEDESILLKTARFNASETGQLNELYNSLSGEKDSVITYRIKRENWFILSGIQGDRKFYSRFEQRNNEIRGYDLSWNANQDSKSVENISVLISNSFYPFGGNPAGNSPTFPTLIRLAEIADAQAQDSRADQNSSAPQAQADGQSHQSENTGEAQTAQNKSGEGVSEQKDGALPPPDNGGLITSDGKGLRFTYHYFPPTDPKLQYAYNWVTESHLFLNIPEIDALDGLFVIPRPLHYVTRQCGAVNAFYAKQVGGIFLCYEMIDDLLQMGQALAKGAKEPEKLAIEFVKDNLRFILLHESGHAMIDLLDIPAVGREEDSVDQLAAVLLLTNASAQENKNDIARIFQLSSVWFKVNSQLAGSPNVRLFADEHSLDAQRYFNLLCIVYGQDPERNRAMVANGMLPEERAARCPDESSKIRRSWARLIVPHLSPKFQPKSDDTDSSQANSERNPSTDMNPLEWDGKTNPFDK